MPLTTFPNKKEGTQKPSTQKFLGRVEIALFRFYPNGREKHLLGDFGEVSLFNGKKRVEKELYATELQ